MLKHSLIGAALFAFTVIIHAIGTTGWLRWLNRHYKSAKQQFDCPNTFVLNQAIDSIQSMAAGARYAGKSKGC